MRRLALTILLSATCLALFAASVQANRPVLSEALLQTSEETRKPPPEGQIEGACGLAVSPPTLYVSDYYHRVVDIFTTSGDYSSQIALPGGPFTGVGVNERDGVCGLAFGDGALYANEWHQGVLRLTPTEASIDTGESTGVAADAAGNLYVDDRTYVAFYEAPVAPGDEPAAKIGEGALLDAYGLAVAADGSRVYVPDAASGKVEVFEPAGNPAVPVAQIAPAGGFTSLRDASLALDPTDGHLVVLDNAQPGYEHPGAALHEFGPAPTYPDLGKLTCTPVFGGPNGIAFDSSGDLFVTDGNSELSNVYEYGPYTSGSVPTPPCAATAAFLAAAPAAAGIRPGPGSDVVDGARSRTRSSPAGTATLARQRTSRRGKGDGRTLVQKGPIRVAVSGGLAPTRLPRTGAAPIDVRIGGLVSSTDPKTPPQLREVSFAFNRAGRLDTKGLPVCRRTDIDPSSTHQALRACGDTLVGEGRFAAAVRLPEQSPFPSAGKVTAFNGVEHGHPVVFAHIYGTKPVPTSIVLPLRIRQVKGRFATRLEASLAGLTGEWGYVKSIDLRLGRTYRADGRRHSFLSAACPAPKGFPGAVFPLARASFGFEGGRTLNATLERSCTVRG
jgi:DNA-binding beta-propeller fold protein YncE